MKLQKTLELYSITSVWHFTDRSNLDSIEKYGLLSLSLLTENNIPVPCYGADALSHSLDRNRGLDKYVHLSLIKEHPMQYLKKQAGLIPNPVWLEIDVSILFEGDNLFSNDVANKNGVLQYNIELLSDKVDLEVLWGRTDWRDLGIKERRKMAKKSELLVANKISTLKIKGVYHG